MSSRPIGLLASHSSFSVDRCNLKSHLASNEDTSDLGMDVGMLRLRKVALRAILLRSA